MNEAQQLKTTSPPVTAGWWVREELEPLQRRKAARDVISILSRAPQAVLGETALRLDDTVGDWTLDERERCQPISYLEIGRLLREEQLASLDCDADVERARPRRHFLRARAATSVRVASPERARKEWNPVNPQVRKGLGGRQVASARVTDEEMLGVFFEQYGDPIHVERAGRRRLFVFEDDPTSKGAFMIRISGIEHRQGRTSELQLRPAQMMMDSEGKGRPRYIVVGVEITAMKDYETRIDLHWAVERLGRSIHWVAAREPDRVSRHPSIYQFYDELKKSRVALYYAYWVNGRVNWDSHSFQINLAHNLAEEDGRKIARRLLSPRIEQWLTKGKGMPGAKRMGFTRDDEDFLVIDEEAWSKIEWIHRTFYDAAQRDEPLSVRELTKRFNTRFGVSICHQKVHDVLCDRIYNDGLWHCTFAGYRVWCKPVDLKGRGIADHVFQRNQETLRVRGGHNSRNPMGQRLLNTVPFLHADCKDVRIPKSKSKPDLLVTPQLYSYGKSYTHYPSPAKHGCAGCAGLSLDISVEHAVITAVRDLVDDETLQSEFAEATFAQESERDDRPSPEQIADVKNQLAQARAMLANMRKQPPGSGGEYGDLSAKAWHDIHAAWEEREEDLQADLDDLEVRALVVPPQLQAIDETLESEFSDVIRRVLTLSVPDDADHRIARAALFKALVSCVVLHTTDKGWFVEIRGPFFPAGQLKSGQMSPIAAARTELEDLVAAGLLVDGEPVYQDGLEDAEEVGEFGEPSDGPERGGASQAQTVNEGNPSLTVQRTVTSLKPQNFAGAPAEAVAAPVTLAASDAATPDPSNTPDSPARLFSLESARTGSTPDAAPSINSEAPAHPQHVRTRREPLLLLSSYGAEQLVYYLQRYERLPRIYARAFDVPKVNRPTPWAEPPADWRPAWQMRIPVPKDSGVISGTTRRRGAWTKAQAMEGLRAAVRELGLDAPLTDDTYQELQREREDIPNAKWLARVARERFDTTAKAMREQARADVAAERASAAALAAKPGNATALRSLASPAHSADVN